MSSLKKNLVGYTALRAAALQSPLVLLHPETDYAALLMAKLVLDESLPTIYYAVQAEDAVLTTFLANLQAALTAQAEGFGKNLRQRSPAQKRDPSAHLAVVAQCLAEDLGQISAEACLLILDDFDFVDAGEEVQPFLEALLQVLPQQMHLVMKARQMPRLAWFALLARQDAAIFWQDGLLLSNPLDFTTEGKQHLDSYAFGVGKVLVNGKLIDTWDGTIPRLLFFFVLLRGQASRTEICQAFWPNSSFEHAFNVFHVTKRRLHQAMGLDVLHFDGKVYRLDPKYRLSSDVLRFLEATLKARQVSKEAALPYWQDVVNLYQAPFLKDKKDLWNKRLWIRDYRAAFRQAYLEALRALAVVAKDHALQNEYLHRYFTMLADEPFNEDLQQVVLDLYFAYGRRDEAADYYLAIEAQKFGKHLSVEHMDFVKRQ